MLSSMFDPAVIAPERIRPISRREYDRMVELGMFEDEKLELLRGVLVTVSPQNWRHAIVIEWLTEKLIRGLDPTYAVRPQLPFAADDWSEPEPDIAVVQKDYTRRDHPSEVLLLIEVADSSLRKDRGLKLEIYAQARVPEYWIVDVSTMTVTVHTVPLDGQYERVEMLRDGDVLRPTRLADIALAVADIPR